MKLIQAFGAYLLVLTQEYGRSKTVLSGAAGPPLTEAAVLGPVLSWLVDRFGSQRVLRIGIALFAIGFLLLSQLVDRVLYGLYCGGAWCIYV